MSNPRYVEQKWQVYLGEVVPEGAGEVQRRECRRAFYAGAKSVISVLLETIPQDGSEPTPADEQVFEALDEEFDLYIGELATEMLRR